MSTITIDELDALKAKISADSDVVASLGKSVAISVSYSGVLMRSLFIILLGHRLLKNMNKLDAACFKCVDICDKDFNFKTNLEKMVSSWNEAIQKKTQIKFPKTVLRWETNLLEQFENKLENYWITSDKEVKELTHSISEKLNKHALHRTV